MTPHLIVVGGVVVHRGDCRSVLAGLPDNFVDSIVTDPPYGIEFMGKEWDAFAPEVARSTAGRTGRTKMTNDGGLSMSSLGAVLPSYGGSRSRTNRCLTCGKRDQFKNPHACGDAAEWVSEVINPDGAPPAMIGFQQWCTEWAREARRVLKPGGHLLAFGGSRTYHRLASAVEDAGFEIRDSIHWVYGSGFPKSMDVQKQMQKRSPDNADTWAGWGTALKPAHEPIVLARKPLIGTVADNVLRYGTGAINIDATRIGFQSDADRTETVTKNQHADFGTAPGGNRIYGDFTMVPRTNYDPSGRWPANVILDGSDEVTNHFPRSKGGTYPAVRGNAINTTFASGQPTEGGARQMGDDGSAARFFAATPYTDLDGASILYVAKPSTAERNAGLDHLDERPAGIKNSSGRGFSETDPHREIKARNFHPTVKPLALMRYLIRLVTPPGGIVLEPFAGSGTTLAAATLEGHPAIGIELTDDYLPIIEARIQWAHQQHTPPTNDDTPPATTQPTLFDTEEAA